MVFVERRGPETKDQFGVALYLGSQNKIIVTFN